jgi:hypothetical protein
MLKKSLIAPTRPGTQRRAFHQALFSHRAKTMGTQYGQQRPRLGKTRLGASGLGG